MSRAYYAFFAGWNSCAIVWDIHAGKLGFAALAAVLLAFFVYSWRRAK